MLLLHGFVNGHSILIVHFIELIDEAHSLISKNKGSSFEHPLLSDWILVDTSSETNGTRSLSSGVHNSWENLLNVFQELRFGSSWVSKQEHVDISSDFVLSSNILMNTSKHCKRESFLDELVAVDTGGNRIENFLSDIFLLGQFSDLGSIFLGGIKVLLITETDHIVGLDDGLEDGESVLGVGSVIKFVHEDSCYFNLITWSSGINKIIEDDNFFLSWDSAWRNGSRSFLNCPFLVVSVNTLGVLWDESCSLAFHALAQVSFFVKALEVASNRSN